MPNVNQIYDLFTPCIPADFEMCLGYAEQAASESQMSASASAGSADDARAYAEEALGHAQQAQAAADEAESWATAKAGISLGPDAPPDATAGSVWLQTDGSDTDLIIAIKRFEAGAAGNGLFPAAGTYPANDTYPNKMGDWSSCTLAAALVTQ